MPKFIFIFLISFFIPQLTSVASAQCSSSHSVLDQAIQNFQEDCDVVYHRASGHNCDFNLGRQVWICETNKITESSHQACFSEANSLFIAIQNFETQCGIPYQKRLGHDCDYVCKKWYCMPHDVEVDCANPPKTSSITLSTTPAPTPAAQSTSSESVVNALPENHILINSASAVPNGGVGYLIDLRQVGGDTTSAPETSTLKLFENGSPIGPAHSLHADIRSQGQGRFSHWHGNLYFSSTTNDDPRNNGKTYSYLIEDFQTVDSNQTISLNNATPSKENIESTPVIEATEEITQSQNLPTQLGNQFQNLKIFPGAEGFGTDSLGGRGGEICFVTNLNDSGPGSFRECVEIRSGRRIVLFRTGGKINLQTPVRIIHPFISIYGQSAPGDGIVLNLAPTIDGAPLQIRSHDVLVQHMRFRPETPTVNDLCCRDAMHIGWQGVEVYNVVIDHNSFSWGTDEIVDTWYNVHDITISYNNISEGLRDSGADNSGGPAGRGVLLGADQAERISFHHNLLAHNQQRNPAVGIRGVADIVNNLVYNWLQRGGQQNGSLGGKVNWVKNLYIAYRGNSSDELNTSSFWHDIQLHNTFPNSVYFEDNIGYRRPNNTLPQWQIAGMAETGAPYNPSLGHHSSTRFSAPKITETSALNLEAELLNRVGAWLPKLDDVDRRILSNVRNRTGMPINCVGPNDRGGEARCQINGGGYPTYSPGNPQTDTDNDGIPDSWEISVGTNPNNFDSANDQNGNGYSNLEEWVHSIK